jgi:hypothetical protein
MLGKAKEIEFFNTSQNFAQMKKGMSPHHRRKLPSLQIDVMLLWIEVVAPVVYLSHHCRPITTKIFEDRFL